MKLIRYALALALLSSGGLFAATTVTTKPAKAAKYKKVEAKKQTHARTKHHVNDRAGKPNGTYQKMEIKKHEKGLRKPVTKAPAAKSVSSRAVGNQPAVAAPAQVAQPAAQNSSWANTLSKWGIGAGAAATATAAVSSTGHRKGYHIGPRDWKENFTPAWVESLNAYGHWEFANRRPDWWKEHYPTYWKDVVGPLYRKSPEYLKLQSKAIAR